MSNSLFSTRLRVRAPMIAAAAALSKTSRVSAQDSPQGSFDRDGDPLTALLAIAPAKLMDQSDSLEIATFADIALQTRFLGLDRPDSIEIDDAALKTWARSLEALYIGEPFQSHFFDLTRSLIGFDLTDVDQILQVGPPPHTLALLRGRFDRDALKTIWADHGYLTTEYQNVEIASNGEDAQIDLDSELSRMVLSRLNNAAILDDDTLIYSATLQGVKDAIDASLGDAPSLGDQEFIRVLVDSLLEPFASAYLTLGAALAGDMLRTTEELTDPEVEDIFATRVADVSQMPPIGLALLGFTPGGPVSRGISTDATPESFADELRARIAMYLLMTLPGSADEASSVVGDRLETQVSMLTDRPYADLFLSWIVEPIEDDSILRIELVPFDFPGRLWRMLFSRDLLFLAF